MSAVNIHAYCWRRHPCTKDLSNCPRNQNRAFSCGVRARLFHELSVHARYSELFYELSYWRLFSGFEVDFVLGSAEVAIAAKGKNRINSGDMRGLMQFKKDFPQVKWRIIVCLEDKMRKTEEDIYIVPYKEFIRLLWDGKFL